MPLPRIALLLPIFLLACHPAPPSPSPPTFTAALPSDLPIFTPAFLQAWQITAEAPSIPQLATQTHATLYTPQGALLWITLNPLAITVEQAYCLGAPGSPDKFVLATFSKTDAPRNDELLLPYLRAHIELDKVEMHDPVFPLTFKELSAHPVHGTLYEFAWPSDTSGGTGHYASERRFYLLRSPKDQWTCLAECPGGTMGSLGGDGSFGRDFQATATWTNNPANPVHLAFRMIEQQVPRGDVDAPDYQTSQRGELDSTGHLRWLTPEQLLVQNGDTWDTLAHRLCRDRYMDERRDLVPRATAVWVNDLKTANPTVITPAAGMELNIPHRQETQTFMTELRKTPAPAATTSRPN